MLSRLGSLKDTVDGRVRAGRGEEGMSLVETLVTLLVVSVFMGLATGLTIHVLGQTAAQRNTLIGVQQGQQAERTFGQYLRSAQATSLDTSTSGNDLVLATNVGTSGTGSPSGENCNGPTGTAPPSTVIVSCVEGMEAMLCPIPNVTGVDSLEIVFGLPVTVSTAVTTRSGVTQTVTTWTVAPLHECIAGSYAANPVCPVGSSGNACGPSGTLTATSNLPASYSSIRLEQSFDVQSPSAAIFRFYTLSTSTTTGGVSYPVLGSPLSTASVDATPTSVQAVGMTATFEPAPGSHRGLYSDERGTTIQTVAFLRNQESSTE